MAARSRGGFRSKAAGPHGTALLPRSHLAKKQFPMQKYSPNTHDLEVKPSHGTGIAAILLSVVKLRLALAPMLPVPQLLCRQFSHHLPAPPASARRDSLSVPRFYCWIFCGFVGFFLCHRLFSVPLRRQTPARLRLAHGTPDRTPAQDFTWRNPHGTTVRKTKKTNKKPKSHNNKAPQTNPHLIVPTPGYGKHRSPEVPSSSPAQHAGGGGGVPHGIAPRPRGAPCRGGSGSPARKMAAPSVLSRLPYLARGRSRRSSAGSRRLFVYLFIYVPPTARRCQ